MTPSEKRNLGGLPTKMKLFVVTSLSPFLLLLLFSFLLSFLPHPTSSPFILIQEQLGSEERQKNYSPPHCKTQQSRQPSGVWRNSCSLLALLLFNSYAQDKIYEKNCSTILSQNNEKCEGGQEKLCWNEERGAIIPLFPFPLPPN